MSSQRNNHMPKLTPLVIGVVAAALIGFGAIYALRSGNNNSVTANAQLTTSNSTIGTKQNPHLVALTKDQKAPIDLLVDVGDYVQFNSKDGGEHQIIQGKQSVEHGHDALSDATNGEEHGTSASPLDSGIIKADEGYLVQFKNVGKYEFHDNYNHHYAVTVIVYDKGKKIEDTKIE